MEFVTDTISKEECLKEMPCLVMVSLLYPNQTILNLITNSIVQKL